jgi:thiosulfate reductase cytochrome b subunit
VTVLHGKDHQISPRHTVLVRVTHWINTASFLALVISAVAILLAHPRLYWGESGGYGSPALIELPLPLDLDQSGWGRSLHFLAAWICVCNGLVYVISGLVNRHFKTALLSETRQTWKQDLMPYTAPQRWAYVGVIFALFPLVIVTGLAMSPAVSSVFPIFVQFFGGQQSSRTVHFFAAVTLVLFLVVHIVMVYRNGFRTRMRTMIYGSGVAKEIVR